MGVFFGKLRIGVEVPKYDVLSKSPRGYEVRKYHEAVAAEVLVEDESQFRGSKGFRALAGYIGAFGAPQNLKQEAIKMTAPVVTQQQGEKIAMTAPVVTAPGGSGYWMQFIMPSKWTLETLPQPENPEVKLKRLPERHVAAMYFSGRTDAQGVEKMEKRLLEYLRLDGIEPKEGTNPVLSRYNDPFTPGLLRTNEIWVTINPPPAET